MLARSLYSLNTAHTYVAYIPRWYDSDPTSRDAGPASNQLGLLAYLRIHETTSAQSLSHLHLTHFSRDLMTTPVLQYEQSRRWLITGSIFTNLSFIYILEPPSD